MNDNVLRLKRLIAASLKGGFVLRTRRDQSVKWWDPEEESALNVRVGGQWCTTVRTPDGRLITVSAKSRETLSVVRNAFRPR
jgi:uncharacterized protein YndB with AHSA1/START domain